jgi:DNA-binding CsgD family transcriptional regulator/tetratricopeptide (TPR) repeat protein
MKPAARESTHLSRNGESIVFGRATELTELRRALRATLGGTGGCVVIEGPAGIGKSRLLSAVRDMADDLGLTVTMGRASEFDRSAPFATLVAALQGSPILSPQLAGLDTVSSPVWLVNRIGELIESQAASLPLVIVIDDAHWADELTAFALPVLTNMLSRSPVLWLLGRRRGPGSRPAQNAIDHLLSAGASCLPLGPLDDQAIAEMCTQLLGVTPTEPLVAELARAGGNPFLAEQLVGGLRDAGHLAVTDGAAQLSSGQLPAPRRDAVLELLCGLSAAARRLLDAGSVLGRPFTVHEAARLTGLQVTELSAVVTETVQAGALADTGAKLTFVHELIREATYDALLSSVREALHREAAVVLREAGRPLLEVAEHLIRGGCAADKQTTATLREALDALAPSAPSAAADLALRTLDLLTEQDSTRLELVATSVRLLARAGRVAEARELADHTLRTDPGAPHSHQLMLGLAEALHHAGHHKAAVSCIRAALTRPGVPDKVRAQLLAIQAHALLGTDEFVSAAPAAAEALESGLIARSPETVVIARAARNRVELSNGNLNDAVAYAQDAVVAADTGGGEARHWHPRLWLASALIATDDFAEAERVLDADRQAAEQLGTRWSEPLWYYRRAQLSMAAGQLDSAREHAEAGMRAAERSGGLALRAPLLALLGQVFLHRHDIPAAQAHLTRAHDAIREGSSAIPEELAWLGALLHEAEGEFEAAFKVLAEVYTQLPGRLHLLVTEPSAGARLVRIARQVGEDVYAERVVAATKLLSGQNPEVATLRGAAAHAAGVLLDDLTLLEEAVEAYRLSPRPLARAVAVEDTAMAKAAAGDRTRAVTLLKEAAELYGACGADRDGSRAGQQLLRYGSRRSPRTAKKTYEVLAGLSECEFRVARLVAEGLTNRQVADRLFLSPHTVDTHLRHSFMKFGVNSRVELTRHIMAHDMDRPARPATATLR